MSAALTPREKALLYLAIAIGSLIGSLLRALASLAAIALAGPDFPWGTLFVNIAGSFVIGFYVTITGPGGRLFAGIYRHQFVTTGFCGGFTTFSIFSLEAFRFFHEGDVAAGGLYIGVSLVTWLAAVWLGVACAAWINRPVKGAA